MFETFTERARRAIVAAQDEAKRLRSEAVGPEHLLLGLLDDPECLGARALDALGVGSGSLRERIGESLAPGGEESPAHIPFTSGAKKVLELSLREARDLGHAHIGTEHLLLGILREHGGGAGQSLAGLGVDLERARAQVAELAEHPSPDGEDEPHQ